MGLLRNAILGPLLIYALLMAHVFYRMLLETPEPLKVPSFPNDFGKDKQDNLVTLRKGIIKAAKSALELRYDGDFVRDWCTDDVEFEDVLEKFVGREEVSSLFSFIAPALMSSSETVVHGEHHGPHEVIMDWTMKMTFRFLPGMPIEIPMRTHFLLELPKRINTPEKIFKISEEWFYNKQLNEKTTAVPLIGRLHQRLRRFTGYMIFSVAQFFT